MGLNKVENGTYTKCFCPLELPWVALHLELPGGKQMTRLEQQGQHTFLWHFAIADVSRAQHVHALDRDRNNETVHLQNLNCLASLRTKVIPACVSSRDK